MSDHEVYGGLDPAPDRLALLEDVDAGLVWRHPDGQDWLEPQPGVEKRARRKVSVAMAELREARWVEVAYLDQGGRSRYHLTPRGRRIRLARREAG